jgi:hypothetical protein
MTHFDQLTLPSTPSSLSLSLPGTSLGSYPLGQAVTNKMTHFDQLTLPSPPSTSLSLSLSLSLPGTSLGSYPLGQAVTNKMTHFDQLTLSSPPSPSPLHLSGKRNRYSRRDFTLADLRSNLCNRGMDASEAKFATIKEGSRSLR